MESIENNEEKLSPIEQTINPRKHFIQIDYAKALGILLVVLGHVTGEGLSKLGIKNDNISLIHKWIYCFHMPLFFILSGLGLYYKYINQKVIRYFNDILNFAQKLLIPYCLWSGIYLIGNLLSSVSFANKRPILTTILERGYAFITLRGAAPLWFLAALFLTNTIFITIIKLKYFTQKKILRHFIFVCILIIIIIFSNQWFSANKVLLPKLYLYPLITLFRIFPSLLYVEIGIILGYFWERIIHIKKFIKAILFVFVTVLYSFLVKNYNCGINMHLFDYNNIYLLLTLGILGSFGLIIFCCLLPEKNNYLSYIGKKSMDIMIIHYPLILSLRMVGILFLKLHLNIYLSVILSAILISIFSLLISKFILQPIRERICIK